MAQRFWMARFARAFSGLIRALSPGCLQSTDHHREIFAADSLPVVHCQLLYAGRSCFDGCAEVAAPRDLVFPGITDTENRERFWRQLYYLGYDEKKFWAELNHADWNFLTGMFSYSRLSPAVVGSNAPIAPDELRAQIVSYLGYPRGFDRERATSPALTFAIVNAENQPDFTNLDRWYERDDGERIGNFVLYRLKLRE